MQSSWKRYLVTKNPIHKPTSVSVLARSLARSLDRWSRTGAIRNQSVRERNAASLVAWLSAKVAIAVKRPDKSITPDTSWSMVVGPILIIKIIRDAARTTTTTTTTPPAEHQTPGGKIAAARAGCQENFAEISFWRRQVSHQICNVVDVTVARMHARSPQFAALSPHDAMRSRSLPPQFQKSTS